MLNIPDIIDLWPSSAELARRIGEKPIVVQRWKSRGRIPGEYDTKLVSQAKEDGLELTYEDLAKARSYDQAGHAEAAIQGKPLISQPDGEAAA